MLFFVSADWSPGVSGFASLSGSAPGSSVLLLSATSADTSTCSRSGALVGATSAQSASTKAEMPIFRRDKSPRRAASARVALHDAILVSALPERIIAMSGVNTSDSTSGTSFL